MTRVTVGCMTMSPSEYVPTTTSSTRTGLSGRDSNSGTIDSRCRAARGRLVPQRPTPGPALLLLLFLGRRLLLVLALSSQRGLLVGCPERRPGRPAVPMVVQLSWNAQAGFCCCLRSVTGHFNKQQTRSTQRT